MIGSWFSFSFLFCDLPKDELFGEKNLILHMWYLSAIYLIIFEVFVSNRMEFFEVSSTIDKFEYKRISKDARLSFLFEMLGLTTWNMFFGKVKQCLIRITWFKEQNICRVINVLTSKGSSIPLLGWIFVANIVGCFEVCSKSRTLSPFLQKYPISFDFRYSLKLSWRKKIMFAVFVITSFFSLFFFIFFIFFILFVFFTWRSNYMTVSFISFLT